MTVAVVAGTEAAVTAVAEAAEGDFFSPVLIGDSRNSMYFCSRFR